MYPSEPLAYAPVFQHPIISILWVHVGRLDREIEMWLEPEDQNYFPWPQF